MADDEYTSKIRDLQKYVPFLDNTIKRLKSENGTPREAQISKLQSLLVILTDTKKKLKYDALKKCEEVILKLYDKVKEPPPESMHKYMCRNPPDEPGKPINRDMPNNIDIDTDVAFSVARQKLNKQAEMATPASPSPPLEQQIASQPVVIPTEKINDRYFRSSSDAFRAHQMSVTYAEDGWNCNLSDVQPPKPAVIVESRPVAPISIPPPVPISNPIPDTRYSKNRPVPIPNNPNQIQMSQNWVPTNKLYQRRTDIQDAVKPIRFNVWNKHMPNIPRETVKERELVDYGDAFTEPNIPLCSPPENIVVGSVAKTPLKPVPIENVPVLAKPEVKEIVLPSTLSKPPLSESDLQDLLRPINSSPTDQSLLNEDLDLDKLEEMRLQINKELLQNKKPHKSKEKHKQEKITTPLTSPVGTCLSLKSKNPKTVERVVKEQDNIFGSLLSSIDEQIMVKDKVHKKVETKKEEHKKVETKKEEHKKVDAKKEEHKKLEKKDSHKKLEKKESDTKGDKKECAKKDEPTKKLETKDKPESKNKEIKDKTEKPKDKVESKSKEFKSKIEIKLKDSKDDKSKDVSTAKDNVKTEIKHKDKLKSSTGKSKEELSKLNDKIKTNFLKDDTKLSDGESSKKKNPKAIEVDMFGEETSTKSKEVKHKSKTDSKHKDTTSKSESKKVKESKKDESKEVTKTSSKDDECKITKDTVKSKEGDKPKTSKSSSSVSKISDSKQHSSSSDSEANKKTVEKLMKDLQEIANPNRISDKYPHKRKLSELPKPPAPLDPLELAKLIDPKSTKQKIPNTEVHPSKLQDPRLRKSLGILSPPPSYEREDEPESFIRSSEFQNPSLPNSAALNPRFPFQNESAPLLSRPDRPASNFIGQQMSMQPHSNMFPNDSNQFNQSQGHGFPNMFHKEPLLETPVNRLDMPNMPHMFQNPMQDGPIGNNMFSSNEQMGNRTPMYEEPGFNDSSQMQSHMGNINHNVFQNELQDVDMRMSQATEPFQPGGMTPGDPFLMPNANQSNVSMRGGMFPNTNRNFNNDQMNTDQFWNRPNPNPPDQFNMQQNRPQNNFNNNFGINFPQNQPNRFQNFPRNQQQRFPIPNSQCNNMDNFSNNYDLSQMNPIDFYDQSQDNQDMHGRGKPMFDQSNPGKSRPFRGRGVGRGFRGNRGGNPHFWAPTNRVDDESRKFGSRSEDSKDDRRRYGSREDSKDDHRRYRSSRDEIREDNRRFREESRDDSRKARDNSRDDPRRHRNESREDRRHSATKDDAKEDSRRNSSRDDYSNKKSSNSREEQPKEETKPKPAEVTLTKSKLAEDGQDIKPPVKNEKTDKTKDEHYSPLDSLYTSDTKQKIGKGYGFQNFKIPKIKRNSIDEVKPIAKKEPSEEKDDVKMDEAITIAEDVTSGEETTKDEDCVKKSEEIKKDNKDEPAPDTNKSEKDQFMDLLKKTFESSDSGSFLQILQTFGLFNQAKTKKIRRIIESDSDDSEDEPPQLEPEIVKVEKPKEETLEEKPDEILAAVVPEVSEEVSEVSDVPVSPEKQSTETSFTDSESVTDNSVIESVGERIKNRRRNKVESVTESSPESPAKDVKGKGKPKKGIPRPRRRNALEMLQDDIKEMFISEGVLTANGQRMCRTMKEALDKPNSPQSEVVSKSDLPNKKMDRVTSTTDEEDLPLLKRKKGRRAKLDFDKPEPIKIYPKRTRSSPRVILEKMDNSEMSKYLHEASENEDSENSDNDDSPVRNVRKIVHSTDTESIASSRSVSPPKKLVKKRGRKPIEKETVESDKESVDEDGSVEQDEDEDEKKTNKRACTKKKKKRPSWALGVIKKHKPVRNKLPVKPPKSPSIASAELSDINNDMESIASLETTSHMSEPEEDDFLIRTDLIPDVNYYLDNRTKYDCKLCNYKGKMIVPHYKAKHSESENMIARLNPTEARVAREESENLEFDSIDAYEEMVKTRKRRQTFVCRFCNASFKEELVAIFFDHLCCHTGEYRHNCQHCPFTTAHRKTLSSHYHNMHPGLWTNMIPPLYSLPPNFRIVFGYLCKGCNYTQLLRENVEKHIKITHHGDPIEIIKISMSSEPVVLVDHMPESVEDEELAIKETKETSDEITKDAPVDTVKESSEDTIEEPLVEEVDKVVEPPKEPDLTAFMASEDVSAQEKLIEDERLKKMQEINSNITPRRLTSQFVDKLKSKLDLHETDEITIDEEPLLPIQTITAKDEVNEDDNESNEAVEEIVDCIVTTPLVAESEETTEKWIAIASTCSLANTEESELEDLGNILGLSVSSDTRNSDTESSIEPEEHIDISKVELPLQSGSKQKGILNTIQRLAENIKNPKPQNISVAELETTHENVEKTQEIPLQDKVIDVGPIQVRFNDKFYEYNCMVPNCGFQTIYKISFTKHCSEQHKNLTYFCTICANPMKTFPMMSLFVHLFDKHKENAKVVNDKISNMIQNLGEDKPDPDKITPGKIRIRRISGDVLSSFGGIETTNPQIKTEIASPPVPQINSPRIPVQTQQALSQEDLANLFQISDVRTLTEEEETHLQLKQSKANLSVLKPTPNVADGKKRIFIMPLSKLIDDTDSNILKRVTKPELANKNVAPVPRASPQTKTNLLIDPADTPTESVVKTQEALTRLLRFPHILFKCPFATCTYSTNQNFNFINHFNIKHKHRNPIGNFCVYCSETIRLGYLVPHVLKEHAHCLFQCAYCFYRAVVPSYVKIHQKNNHATEQINVIPVQPSENLTRPEEEPLPKIQTIKPYVCNLGNFTCSVCSIKEESAQKLIEHYGVHGIGMYQCRFCLHGTSNPELMLQHYGIQHPGMLPTAYVRQFVRENEKKSSLYAICLEDIETVDLEKLNANIISSIEQKQLLLMPKYSSEPAKDAPRVPTPPIAKTLQRAAAPNSKPVLPVTKPSPTVLKSPLPVLKALPAPKAALPVPKAPPAPKAALPVPKAPPAPKAALPVPKTPPAPKAALPAPKAALPAPKATLAAPKAAIPAPKAVKPIAKSPEKPASTSIVDKNQQPDDQLLEAESLNEPLVTLKHRSAASRSAIENAIDPLILDVETIADQTEKKVHESSDIDISKKYNKGSNTGHSGLDLYQCGTPGCNFKAPNLKDFKSHLFSCELLEDFGGWYNCIHCQKRFKFVGGLIEHIPIHGVLIYNCALCSVRAPLSHLIVRHMKIKHKVNNIRLVPNPNNIDEECEGFIATPVPAKTIKKTKDDISPDDSDNSQTTVPTTIDAKNMYGPDDIERLPRPPVYSQEIHCKLCSYNTKVRSNMQRHLQQHQDEMTLVPETAPVNPVPCLEKNEKMFDKMTNLAASSLCGQRMGGKSGEKTEEKRKEDEAALPGFIPVNKRYVCGAANCNYLTHGETMLRHHFTALHLDDLTYKCPHCNLQLENDIDGVTLENILSHLKMHDLHLYKCTHCHFHHYQKNKVDKHVSDKHPDRIPYIHVIRELDASANSEDSQRSIPLSASSSVSSISTLSDQEAKPWNCGFCPFRCPTRNGIQSHAVKIHGIKSQFKCGLCHFRCSAKNNYNSHFKTKHPNTEVNIISVYFRSNEDSPVKTSQLAESPPEPEVFDTTPLWSRDKPRIRHIRGILLDEVKSNKKSQKSTEKLEPASDKTRVSNLEKTVDEVAKNLFGEGGVKIKQEKKKEVNLVELKFGPENYGQPVNNMYSCPYCLEFTSTSAKRFITHLYEEFNYYRCVCNYCDLKFTDINLAKCHFTDDHSTCNKEVDISPLSSNGRIERWVEKCVNFQQKEIKRIEEESALLLLEKATRPLSRAFTSDEILNFDMEDLESPSSKLNRMSDMLDKDNKQSADNDTLFEFSDMPILISQVPPVETATSSKINDKSEQLSETYNESSDIKRQFFEIQDKTSETDDKNSVTDEQFLKIQEKYFEMKKESLEKQRKSLEMEKKSLKMKALINDESDTDRKIRESTPENNQMTPNSVTSEIREKISPKIEENINEISPNSVEIIANSPEIQDIQEKKLTIEKKLATPKCSAIVAKYLGILEKSNIAGKIVEIRESSSGKVMQFRDNPSGVKSPRIAEKLQKLSGKSTNVNYKSPIVIKKSSRIGINKSPIKYVTISGISSLMGQTSKPTEALPESSTKPQETKQQYLEISGITSLKKQPSETLQSFVSGSTKYSFVSLNSSESSEISSIQSSQASEKSAEGSQPSLENSETLTVNQEIVTDSGKSIESSPISESSTKMSDLTKVSPKSFAKILKSGKKFKLKSILKPTQIKYVNTYASAKAGSSKRLLRPSRTTKIAENDAIFSDSDDQTLNSLRSSLKSTKSDETSDISVNVNSEQTDSSDKIISNESESSPKLEQTLESSETLSQVSEKLIDDSSELESSELSESVAISPIRKGRRTRRDTILEKVDTSIESEHVKVEFTEESESDAPKKNALQCTHCSFIAKTQGTLRKHTSRHFGYKPFHCVVCNYQTLTLRGINSHFTIKHPNEPVQYKELPAPEVPTFQPVIKRKRCLDDTEAPAEKVQKPDLKLVKTEKTEDKDLISYVCLHCPRRSEVLATIRDHFFQMHEKVFKGVFRYKKTRLDRARTTKYSCKYCTWHGHPDGLKQHHLELHSDKSWILDKAFKYRCVACLEIFSKPHLLRKHCNVNHKNEPLAYQTIVEEEGTEEIVDSVEIIEETISIKPEPKVIKCDYCADTFQDTSQLVNHHNLLHSHLELKADIPVEQLKKYKCPHPTCTHSSNSYPSMRDHLRSHNKPFKCHYCSLTGCYPNIIKTHHVKEHRSLPFKYDQLETAQKLNEELRDNLLILDSAGVYQSKSNSLKRQSDLLDIPSAKVLALDPSAAVSLDPNQTTVSGAKIKRSNIAKKSTAMPPRVEIARVARKSTTPCRRSIKELEGYSFYGTKPRDISEYKTVMSEINIMGKTRPINVVAMSHVLNLFPRVLIEDCRKDSNI